MAQVSYGTVSPATFVWIIPSIPELLPHAHTVLRSPDFLQQDSIWTLELHILRGELLCSLLLSRKDSGPRKTFTYSIKIKGRTNVVEITKTRSFKGENDPELVQKLKKNDSWNSDILITCYIKSHTTNPVTEMVASTCAVQRVVPNSISCAIQTEAVDSVIEKEKSKAEDWSSLDMKGVAVLTERMKELLIKGIDHDVTICVQDKEFRAHRNILSSRSPVFAKMLTHDTKENKTSTINIEDCDPETFHEFLLHVYSGRSENLTPSNAPRLYYTADKYDFPVLKEQCVSLLKTALSVESICNVVLLAAKHREKELLQLATEFFARNVKKILVTISWKNFLLQNPDEANELYIKSMEILHPEN